MNEAAAHRLFALLTGSASGDWRPVDHVLEVQDGAAIGHMLNASDRVNFLGEEDFVRLCELASS